MTISWRNVDFLLRFSLDPVFRPAVTAGSEPVKDNSDESQDDCDRDIRDYISSRCLRSPEIVTNIRVRDREDDSRGVLERFSQHVVRKAAGCFLYVKLLLDFMEKGQIVIKSDSFKLLPQSLSEMYKLSFSLMFSSGQAYEPVSALLSVCLASLRPLSLSSLHAVLNSVCLEAELTRPQLEATHSLISSQLVTRGDGSLMLGHPTLRDWLLRGGRGEGHRFGVNVRAGHLALALYYARSQNIDSPQQILELSHHILKSNLHKHYPVHQTIPPPDLQSLFLSLSVQDISLALASPTNILYPSVRVSNLLLLAGADPNILVSNLYTTNMTSSDSSDEARGDMNLLSVHSSLGHTDMVSLLLEWGADVNAASDSGVTVSVLK